MHISNSDNRKMLKDAGIISHSAAIEKATKEYRKFQTEHLSPVEKEYLNTVKTLQKKVFFSAISVSIVSSVGSTSTTSCELSISKPVFLINHKWTYILRL